MTDLLTKYDIKYPYCGFNCPPGWLWLVEKLIQDLIALGWDKDLHQVKEKFGGLRFYTGATSIEMDELINKAENLSRSICQECSLPGSARSVRGWLTTLCSYHHKEKVEVWK